MLARPDWAEIAASGYSDTVPTRLAALAVIALAAALRIWGLQFGLPHTLTRPDEEAVFAIAQQVFQRHFNPQFFDWPSLYLYAVGAAQVLYFNVERLAGRFTYEYDFLIAASQNPGPLFLIARAITAAAGTATVWLVYRTGLRLFDRRIGLIAALFLAVVPLHARDSHFGVPDITATALVAASFLFTVRYWQSERSKDVLLAAMFAGLAASAKYNAGLVAVPALLAVVHPREGGWRFGPSQIRLSAIVCVIAMAAFLLGTPYRVARLARVPDWTAARHGAPSRRARRPSGMGVARTPDIVSVVRPALAGARRGGASAWRASSRGIARRVCSWLCFHSCIS